MYATVVFFWVFNWTAITEIHAKYCKFKNGTLYVYRIELSILIRRQRATAFEKLEQLTLPTLVHRLKAIKNIELYDTTTVPNYLSLNSNPCIERKYNRISQRGLNQLSASTERSSQSLWLTKFSGHRSFITSLKS